MKKTLLDLEIGQQAQIKSLTDKELQLKLMDMGCLPGTDISIVFKAPYNGPICVEVCGSKLALRRNEAVSVVVEF